MTILKISDTASMDLDKLISTRLLINANSGGGKSWAIRRLLEQSHGHVQQIVIDLEGEFSTLREKYDYLLVGHDGEVPISIRTAELLGRKLLELNVSTIIDLSELKHVERILFVKRFLDSLINAPKELWHPVLIIVDEAHQFCPEGARSESASAVIDLMTRGRKRGFCGVLATQRISKLNKDAAAEANNYLIGRTGLDIDMKRAGELLGLTSKEDIRALRDLKAGEFHAFGAAFKHSGIEQISVGEVHTTHERVYGGKKSKPVKTPENIKKILKDVADLPKEAEEELRTIADYKKQNTELKGKLTIAEKTQKTETRIQEKVINVTDEKALQSAKTEGFREAERIYKSYISSVEQNVKVLRSSIEKLIKGAQNLLESKAFNMVGDFPTPVPSPVNVKSMKREFVKVLPVISNRVSSPIVDISDANITGPEQKVLNAIAWCESIGNMNPPNELVSFLSGYSHFRSTGYTNPRGYLKAKGLIEYSSGNVSLTESGRSLAHAPESPLTQDELHRVVLDRLDGPEQKVLRPLLASYPEPISNTELCSLAGYQHDRSTGYTNPRGKLKSFGLIEYSQNGVKALPLLFIN